MRLPRRPRRFPNIETRNNIIASCANWGNISTIASYTYSWDDADRLTKFDHPTGTANDSVFAYLPGSATRYKRTQDTTVEYYIYDGDDVLGSYTAGGTLNARYVTPGLDDNLSETRGGSQYYYMQDGLGSVRNIVDSSETLQNRYDHYAFGDNIGGAQLYGVDNTYWYTGREYEWGSIYGMHYYRNRYYLPYLGIFASRDAIWADVTRGWGYVENNPVGSIDPMGLSSGQWTGSVDPWQPGGPFKGGVEADFSWMPPSDATCTEFDFVQISWISLYIGTWYGETHDEHDWQIDDGKGDFYYGASRQQTGGVGFQDFPGDENSLWGVQRFETCAVCKCGEDAGKIYSCISWGYTQKSGGTPVPYQRGVLGNGKYSPGLAPSRRFQQEYASGLAHWKASQKFHKEIGEAIAMSIGSGGVL